MVVTLGIARGGSDIFFMYLRGVKVFLLQLEGGQHFFFKFYKGARVVLNKTSEQIQKHNFFLCAPAPCTYLLL